MKSKSAEFMLKNPYPSMIKVDEKQERRTHAKNPYPSMIKVDEKQERRTHAKKSLSKYDKSG